MAENRTLDEIVFENRNKAYGAYDLRNSSKRYLLLALLIGILAFLFVVGSIVFYNKVIASNKKAEIVVDVNLQDVEVPEVPIEEVKPPEPEPEPEQQTHYQEETAQVKVVMPEPKVVVTKPEEPIAKVSEMDKKDLGLENREGKESDAIAGGGKVNLDKDAGKYSASTNQTEPVKSNNTKPSTVTAKTAAFMAVYPGCEKEAQKGKEATIRCFSSKISGDLQTELQDFAEKAADEGITKAVAKLDFIVDTNGNITKVSPIAGSDKLLGPESKKALESLNSKLSRKGKKIVPAKMEDGKAVNLKFQVPVNFILQ